MQGITILKAATVSVRIKNPPSIKHLQMSYMNAAFTKAYYNNIRVSTKFDSS